MLTINDLVYRLGGRLLFDHAGVFLPGRSRAGFVGRNGAGKTTLFRLISGEIAPESGAISIPARTRLGRVEQEAPGGPTALIDFVLAADLERADLLARAEAAHDAHDIADIQTRLADIDAHSAPARAAAILHGLGFDAAAQRRPLSEFSGGWRMRVALGGGAVRAARPAAPRRADQLSRSRRHAVAGRLSVALSGERRSSSAMTAICSTTWPLIFCISSGAS